MSMVFEDDLIALTKFKNLKLWNLRGNKSWRQIGEESGAGYNATLNLLALKKSPMSSRGGWLTAAVKLANYFAMEPDELFPLDLYRLMLPLQGKYVQRVLSATKMLSLVEARQQHLLPEHTEGNPLQGVEDELYREETHVAIMDVLRTLQPRSEKIIRMRFGLDDGQEHTLDEVAEAFSLTPERIRQVEAKAIRKLRLPDRAWTLRKFLDK